MYELCVFCLFVCFGFVSISEERIQIVKRNACIGAASSTIGIFDEWCDNISHHLKGVAGDIPLADLIRIDAEGGRSLCFL